MIRFATVYDAEALLSIYGQYIDTSITFEYVLPSVSEFQERIRQISQGYPYLVYEENGAIRGYAYAHRHQERAAYQWNAELSVYLDRRIQSRGVGKKLYAALLELLTAQGVKTAYGCITLPNRKSVGLHKAMGFSSAGVHHRAGYKNGRWHDVVWYEKALGPYGDDPAPVTPIGAVGADKLLEKYH